MQNSFLDKSAWVLTPIAHNSDCRCHFAHAHPPMTNALPSREWRERLRLSTLCASTAAMPFCIDSRCLLHSRGRARAGTKLAEEASPRNPKSRCQIAYMPWISSSSTAAFSWEATAGHSSSKSCRHLLFDSHQEYPALGRHPCSSVWPPTKVTSLIRLLGLLLVSVLLALFLGLFLVVVIFFTCSFANT